MYNARGVPLHTRATPSPADAPSLPSSPASSPASSSPTSAAPPSTAPNTPGAGAKQQAHEPWRVPAERRRVTEYLVLEKKGWSATTPWQFREQMW